MTSSAPREIDYKSRRELIASISTPLNFLVLVVLIVEALLGTMAFVFPELRVYLIACIVFFFSAYSITIIALAIWRPDVLQLSQTEFADALAKDLVIALDGSLSNLTAVEREEAWITVVDVLSSTGTQGGHRGFQSLRSTLVSSLSKYAEIRRRKTPAQGVIRP